jgi:glycosyltransferase involved in cell wall biosynthesis
MLPPSVSALIPTYARPDCLARALASVIADAPADAEILVGDNGQQGQEVVDRARDERVRYVRNRENLGMVGNWSALVARSQAPMFLLLMDDDMVLPGFFAACLETMRAGPDLGVVFANHYNEHDGIRDVRACTLPEGRHDDFARVLMELAPVPMSSSLVRRAAWSDAVPLPHTGAADVVLWARIAEAGWAFHYLDQPLMVYARHAGAHSAQDAFRSETVSAYDAFSFSDAAADGARRRRLADALLNRAAWYLRERRGSEAKADVARARRLGPSSTVRLASLQALTTAPRLGSLAVRAGRRAPVRPWATGFRKP